jgi:hypothetical protein
MHEKNSNNAIVHVKINGNNVAAMLKKKWTHEKLYKW